MKPEIKAALVAALESGEYKQGTGFLHEGDCFCLEGVLCDLAVKAGVAQWRLNYKNVWAISSVGADFWMYRSVPHDLVLWAGLEDLELQYQGERRYWYELNDGRGIVNPLTFPDLAKLIKEQM